MKWEIAKINRKQPKRMKNTKKNIFFYQQIPLNRRRRGEFSRSRNISGDTAIFISDPCFRSYVSTQRQSTSEHVPYVRYSSVFVSCLRCLCPDTQTSLTLTYSNNSGRCGGVCKPSAELRICKTRLFQNQPLAVHWQKSCDVSMRFAWHSSWKLFRGNFLCEIQTTFRESIQRTGRFVLTKVFN